METDDLIHALRSHERELRAAGIRSLSLFGSAARGEAGPRSDVDVVVELDESFAEGGFAYFGRLDALGRKIEGIVGRKIDIVTEPVRKERLRRRIDEDRVRAF